MNKVHDINECYNIRKEQGSMEWSLGYIPIFMCIERTDRSYHGENKIKKNDRSNPAGKQYSGIKGS